MSLFAFYPRDFALSFLSILAEGLPFVLLGTLLSGVIDAWLPPKVMERWLPRNRNAAVAVSGLLGLVFPMCECGIVPVIRRLLGKGLPLSCAVTYMLSAPILNPLVIISTLAAFRGQDPWTVTLLRLVLGYLVAVAVGWVVLKVPVEAALKSGILKEGGHEHGHGGGWRDKCRQALRTASRDFLDVAFYLALGAAVASLFNTGVDQSRIEPLASHVFTAVPAMMILSGLLSLCSSSDAFVAASFFTFPVTAKLAFLVFGPMVDLKLLFLYSSVFRKRFVALMVLGIFVVVALLCIRLGGFYA